MTASIHPARAARSPMMAMPAATFDCRSVTEAMSLSRPAQLQNVVLSVPEERSAQQDVEHSVATQARPAAQASPEARAAELQDVVMSEPEERSEQQDVEHSLATPAGPAQVSPEARAAELQDVVMSVPAERSGQQDVEQCVATDAESAPEASPEVGAPDPSGHSPDAMENLSEYEKLRLKNIERNNCMLAKLDLFDVLGELGSGKKKRGPPKGYKQDREKLKARRLLIVPRRSLRNKGMAPNGKGLDEEPADAFSRGSAAPKGEGPLAMRTLPMPGGETLADQGDLLSELQSLRLEQPEYDKSWESRTHLEFCAEGPCPSRILSLSLEEDGVAKVVPERILNLTFLHVRGTVIVAAGDKAGHVGFWNTNRGGDQGVGVHLYQPHSAPVSGIAACPIDFTKLLTCSHDGFVRLMDVETATFEQLHWSSDILTSVAYAPLCPIVAYVGEGEGVVRLLDSRVPKHANSYSLHERKINSIDFHHETPTLMTTASHDGAAATWDTRKLRSRASHSVATFAHDKAVHGAYYSPSGHQIVTTSYDDNVRFWKRASSGLHDEPIKVPHDNQTNRWISCFRAIWGWDDNLVFVGSKKRSIDVISATTKGAIGSLISDHMSGIPASLACHPLIPGIIGGGSGSGVVYVWRA